MIKWDFLIIVIGFTIFSCSNQQRDSDTTDIKSIQQADSLNVDGAIELPDRLFALIDIKSTNDLGDKLQKLQLVQLDSLQKFKLVATCPGLDTYPGLGTYWIMNDWHVTFIARQKTMGDFSPIIVAVGGTDFGAYLLIVLDKENHPKSYRILAGGECSDPYCDIVNSTFQDGKIISYKISCKSEPVDRAAMVDSFSYLSTVSPTGQIETKRTDSTRYSRLFK